MGQLREKLWFRLVRNIARVIANTLKHAGKR